MVEAGRVEGPSRRPATAMWVALLLVAGLAVGGVAVVTTLGGSGAEVYGYGGHLALPAAVTEEPDRDWTWQVPGTLTGLAIAGDATYVATEDGTVTALDGDGDEDWTADVGWAGFLVTAPDHDEVVIFDDIEHRKVHALSSDDGDELWTVDGFAQWIEGDDIYVGTDKELTRYDLGSGDEAWSADAGTVLGVGEAGIFVVVDDELRALGDGGETRWTADIDRTTDPISIAVAEDFVAVGGPQETVAFDADDGDRLWSAPADDSGASVSVIARDEVAIGPAAGSDGDADGVEIALYDRDGSSGSIETAGDFYPIAFRSGGEDYVLDLGSGELYGDDHQVIETYGGPAALAAEGLYALEHGEVRYYRYGDADPRWTIGDDLSANVNVQTGDGRLLVADDGRLSSYS